MPNNHNPVNKVQWTPIEKILPNEYSPNHMSDFELQLLYISIQRDGYTLPIVTTYDKKADKYIIVDGYYRYIVMKRHKDIYDKNNGLLPIVVIDKPKNDTVGTAFMPSENELKASTIRHNRARGKHSIQGLSEIVVDLLNSDWTEEQACLELGLEKEELIRLKHITGYATFFKDTEYTHSKENHIQIENRLNGGKNGDD